MHQVVREVYLIITRNALYKAKKFRESKRKHTSSLPLGVLIVGLKWCICPSLCYAHLVHRCDRCSDIECT